MERKRFFFNLGLLGAAAMLVIASLAFDPGAVFGVGVGIGTAGLVGSLWFVASAIHHRSFSGGRELRLLGRTLDVWPLLGGSVVSVALWEIVQSAVFTAAVAKWLTFSNGMIVGGLACAGLIVHEVSTERVIHMLEVVERPRRDA
jgi:hypothetical protein